MGRYTVLGSGADCKSAVSDSPGSNPGRPTKELGVRLYNQQAIGRQYQTILASDTALQTELVSGGV